MIQLLKDRVSFISPNLYEAEGNKPITFLQVSQHEIILKKNLV